MPDFQDADIFLLGFIIFLTGSILLLIGAYIQKSLTRFKKRFLLDNHRKSGATGEKKAKEYLLKNGFKILKEQAVLENQLLIDGKPEKFHLRADFIVYKDGKLSVVDAKSGIEESDPNCIQTRRQLLEYFIYYNADDVYVFNNNDSTLHSVSFLFKNTSNKRVHIGYLFLLMIVIELIMIVLIKTFGIKMPFIN